MPRIPARRSRRRSTTGADDPIGRSPDPALRQYLLLRVGIGLPIVLFALATLSLTIANARDARAFERRARVATAHIVSVAKDDQAWIQHVAVEYTVDGSPRQGRAPVIDPEQYDVGQSVRVLYDGSGRVLLDAERYDAASPAFYGTRSWSAAPFPSSSVGGGYGGCGGSRAAAARPSPCRCRSPTSAHVGGTCVDRG